MPEANKSSSNAFEQGPILPVQPGFNPAWAQSGPLSQEIKEITTLYNMAVAAGSSLNLKQVIRTLYKESGRLVNTANFAIILYDEPAGALNFALVFDQGHRLKPFSIPYAHDQTVVTRVLANEAPLLIHDLPEAGDMHAVEQIHADKPVRSWLGVPILNPVLLHEDAQGVIATWSYKPNQFTEHELWLLSAIGTQAAIAIRNARLYESSQQRATEMARLKDIAQRRVAEMELLTDITRTLSATLEFDEVLRRIMERVEGILKAEAGWLLLTEPPTGVDSFQLSGRPEAFSQPARSHNQEFESESAGELGFQIGLGKTRQRESFASLKGLGLADEVAYTGHPKLVADVTQAERSFAPLEQALGFSVHSILCVPLILHHQIIGVLEVVSKRGDEFTQTDLELLNSIVPYAAIAIKNARFHESVLAERDRVIEAEEQARRALARDLHDGPTQMVSAMMMRLDYCKLLLEKEPDKLAQELATTHELANQAIYQIRTLLFELRPLALEAQGLVAALHVFLERRQKDVENSIKLTLKTKTIHSNHEISRQDDKVEGAIFAIVREAVNNAIKHASATTITVELEETFTAIYTTISDDGQGFNVDEVMGNYEQRGSLGMINIRERAELIGSELTLDSAPGRGTRIAIRVPKAKEERLKKRRDTGPLTLPAKKNRF